MYRKLHLVLAVAAGLVGGLASRFITPAPVRAQAPEPLPLPAYPPPAPTPALREMRSQAFTLVDPRNNVVGTFTTLRGTVVLLDPMGKEIWRAGISLRPATQ